MSNNLFISVNDENREKLSEFLSTLEKKFQISTELNKVTEGTKRILLIGGDGSINYLLNQVEDLKDVSIFYIPYGTANDFAKSLKLQPVEPTVDLIEQVFNNAPQVEIPVLRCNDKRFINVATGGPPAEVTESGSDFLKKATGKFSYYVSAIEKAISPDIIKLNFKVDENEKWSEVISPGFSVSQGMYAGGGVKLTESMTPNFGEKFNFITLKASELAKGAGELIKLQKLNYVKEENTDELISVLTTKLEIKSDKEIPLKLDGEDYSSDHLVFEKLKTKVNFYIY